jgi:hypothetical protein
MRSTLRRMSTHPTASSFVADPVTEAYRSGIDVTLLRYNLTLTPTQRVEQLAQLLELAEEAWRAGRALRRRGAPRCSTRASTTSKSAEGVECVLALADGGVASNSGA